jgi:hypothetical protein
MVRVGWEGGRRKAQVVESQGPRKTLWETEEQGNGDKSNPTTQTITFLAHYGINVWNTGAAIAPRIAPFFPLPFLLSDKKAWALTVIPAGLFLTRTIPPQPACSLMVPLNG